MNKPEFLVSNLATAKLDVLWEIALIENGTCPKPEDSFSGFFVEGYEFAFLDLEAKTTCELEKIDIV